MYSHRCNVLYIIVLRHFALKIDVGVHCSATCCVFFLIYKYILNGRNKEQCL